MPDTLLIGAGHVLLGAENLPGLCEFENASCRQIACAGSIIIGRR